MKLLFVAKLDTNFRHKREKVFLEQILKQNRYFDETNEKSSYSKLFMD